MARERPADSLRKIEVDAGFLEQHPATVLYSSGRTRVLCAATLEEGVPAFLEGTSKGWATAEYDLLPASTGSRRKRERGGKLSGRTQEIQRLIGRSLRAAVDLSRLGENTITLDCDVIQADGGTRTASITGAFVALVDAINGLQRTKRITADPLQHFIASVSVGVYRGEAVLDLDYAEDSTAETDLNVVMTDAGEFIEVQGTAEAAPFKRDELDRMLDLADGGIRRLIECQRAALAEG